MAEADVRKAIGADFGASSLAAVKAVTNAAEQTHVLSLKVPDVLPSGGVADVAYVFGYKTKSLIQVSLIWSKATDPALTPEHLATNAEILRTNFTEQGFPVDSTINNLPTRNGLVAFRGTDGGGHTVALLLQGPMPTDKVTPFVPASLMLLYVADTKHPDVFRLAPGQF